MPKQLTCKKHKETYEEGESCSACDRENWTPADALDDEDQEAEVSTRARAHARYEFLKAGELAKLKKGGKKGSGGNLFED